MPGTKSGTPGAEQSPTSDAPWEFSNDLFMERTTAILGEHANDHQRAAHVGISRTTLNRLRSGAYWALSMHKANTMCVQLGVAFDELFPRRAELAKVA